MQLQEKYRKKIHDILVEVQFLIGIYLKHLYSTTASYTMENEASVKHLNENYIKLGTTHNWHRNENKLLIQLAKHDELIKDCCARWLYLNNK